MDTMSNPTANPNMPDAGVGDESENTRRASKKTTSIVMATVRPRVVTRAVAVDVAIDGRTSTTHEINQAPRATMNPSAATWRDRDASFLRTT